MRELVVCLLCLALLAPRAASALDPGAIEAWSARYEPLDARIALHDVQAGDSGEIKVTLGSRAQFEIAGVPRPFHLTFIEFTVVEQEDGLAYIRLRTDDPIIEPSLTFLINVDWPRGHAIRGYNLKLSPPARGTTSASASRHRTAPEGEGEPEAAPAAPAPSIPVPSTLTSSTLAPSTLAPSTPAPSTPAPSTLTPSTPAPSTLPSSTLGSIAGAAATPAPTRASDAASSGQASTTMVIRTAGGGTYGPVQPTDTLWAIALRFRPDDSISVHRMMLAFVEANPQAFRTRNVNGLKAGVTLRIPIRSEIGLDDRTAVAEVQRQNLAWKQNRESSRTAAPARAAPVPDVPVSAAPSAGSTPPAPAPAPPSPDTGTQGGRLEVVAPGPAPDAAVPEEGTDVQALRNELALAMEAADAKHLENEEIASRLVEAEKRIEDLYLLVELKNDEIAALRAELRAAAEAEPALARTLPETAQPEGKPSPDTAQAEGRPAPDTAQAEETPPPDTPPPEAEEPAIGPDTLAINPMFLVAAAGALLLLLGVVALRRRRRRRVLGVEDDGLVPPATFFTSGEAPLDAGDDVPGAAVGRDAPAGRGSATAAPGSAAKVRGDEAGGDLDFSIGGLTASEAGTKADPASPADGPAGGLHSDRSEAPAADSRTSAGHGAATGGPRPEAPATDSGASAGRGAATGGPRPEAPAADSRASAGAPAAGARPERRLPTAPGSGVPVADGGAALDPGTGRGGSGGATDTLPMQSGSTQSGSTQSGSTQSGSVQLGDGAGDEGETGVFAPDGSGGGIVQTKIDLAQVYVEMGDAENARLFLRQALSEGDADQRETARAMLSKLA